MWILCSFFLMYLLFNIEIFLKLVRRNRIEFQKVSSKKQKKILRKKYNFSWEDRYIKHITWCEDNLYKIHSIPIRRVKECNGLRFILKYTKYKISCFLRKYFLPLKDKLY